MDLNENIENKQPNGDMPLGLSMAMASYPYTIDQFTHLTPKQQRELSGLPQKRPDPAEIPSQDNIFS
ncbi:MAG: hypothetical protein IJ737_05575 [Ruminococcus sp.]|nr:hypothetical protein [Ruminococcus sp.]